MASSYAINATVAPDSYTDKATIDAGPINRFTIDVLNQGIYWNLKIAVGGGGNWDGTEVFMPPGSRVIGDPDMVGVRFRAAVPLAQIPAGILQAVVTIRAVQ